MVWFRLKGRVRNRTIRQLPLQRKHIQSILELFFENRYGNGMGGIGRENMLFAAGGESCGNARNDGRAEEGKTIANDFQQ